MTVTVDEEGRAVAVGGDAEHPITAGFLCGKVSNYLDRVYSPERILHPLVREGARGEGQLPPGLLGRGARPRGRPSSAGARRTRRRGHPALQLRRHPGPDPGEHDERAGDERARSLEPGAHHLRHRGMVGTSAAHGVSPEVDPEEWPHARHLLVWGWNPMSTAPHLWRKLLEARRAGARLVVVDPFRSRTARVADEHLSPLPGTDAALAIGMMRAVVDAGLEDEAWCREYTDGYDELLARAGGAPGGAVCGGLRRSRRDDRARGREFATAGPSLLRLGVGAQRHLGAPAAYSTIASLPLLTGAWRQRGGGCSYIPMATAAAVSSHPLEREDLRPHPVRTINMSQLGARAHRPGAGSTGEGDRGAGTRIRPRSRPTRAACWPGSRARTFSPSCSSSS